MNTLYQNLELIPDFVPGTGVAVKLCNIRNIHPHLHKDVLEFIYCIEGSVEIHDAHETLLLQPGELFTIDVEDIHYLHSTRNNLVLLVHVDLKNARIPLESLQNTLFACESGLVNDSNRRAFNEVCDKLLALAYAKVKKKGQELITIFEEIRLNLLDLLANEFTWFKVKDLGPEDIKYRKRLQQIISYVSEHRTEKITIGQISDILYLNPTYLSRFMQRTSFESFTGLVNFYRALHAQMLLIETDEPVGEISSLCGFSSEKYFYRHFKYWWNTTPLQYRKKVRTITNQEEECFHYPAEHTESIIKDHIADRYINIARYR